LEEFLEWPNFFIVGAPKAGTSSLYAYFNDISGIYMSPVKEPNFFSRSTFADDHPIKPIRDKKKYLELFKGVKDEKIIGEASTSYLADPDAPKLIHEVSPDAKILISLRDPVEQAFSAYLMFLRVRALKTSFHEQIKKEINEKIKNSFRSIRLDRNLNFENVKRYQNIFGNNAVKIIIFEEFVNDTKSEMESILKFLGINYSLDNFKPEIYNKFAVSRGPAAKLILKNKSLKRAASKILSQSTRKTLREKLLVKNPTKPTMEFSDRKSLVKFYYDDVQKLKELLGRNLPWKDF